MNRKQAYSFKQFFDRSKKSIISKNIKSKTAKKSRFAYILGEMQAKYPDYELFHQGEKFTRYDLFKSMKNTFDA